MYIRKRFLAVAGAALLFGGLTTGNAIAQVRRVSMPLPTVPPTILPMTPISPVPMLPVLPTQLVNPLIGGLSTSLADPVLQYVYMLNRYGSYSMGYPMGNPYSMPYSAAGYQSGADRKATELVVHLPIANGRVWIDGVEAKKTGSSTRRVPVPAGQNHEVNVKASWTIDGKTKSEERTVPLNGSGYQVVNFLVPQGR